MRTTTITQRQFDRLVERLDWDYDIDADVRLDYSGRGMMGRNCLAFSGDISEFNLGYAIGRLVTDDDDEFDWLEGIGNSRSDNLGLGVVIYFPSAEISIEDESC